MDFYLKPWHIKNRNKRNQRNIFKPTTSDKVSYNRI